MSTPPHTPCRLNFFLRLAGHERSNITNGTPPPEAEASGHNTPSTSDARDLVAGRVRLVRASAVAGAYDRNDSGQSWQRGASEAVAGARDSASRPSRHSHAGVGRNPSEHEVVGGSHAGRMNGTRRRKHNSSAASITTDRWDPAVRFSPVIFLIAGTPR